MLSDAEDAAAEYGGCQHQTGSDEWNLQRRRHHVEHSAIQDEMKQQQNAEANGLPTLVTFGNCVACATLLCGVMLYYS